MVLHGEVNFKKKLIKSLMRRSQNHVSRQKMIIGLSKHQIDIDETHSFSVHIAFWAISLHSFLWINTTSFDIAYRLFCECNAPWKWRVLHKNIFPYLYAFSSVCTCCTVSLMGCACYQLAFSAGTWRDCPVRRASYSAASKPAAARNFINVINLEACSAATSHSSYVGPAPIYNFAICRWGLCAILRYMPHGL